VPEEQKEKIIVAGEEEKDGETAFSNSDWKEHPLTQKLRNEIASLKGEFERKKSEEEKIRRAEELKKAEDEGRLKEELQKLQRELDEEKQKFERTLDERDIESSLVRAGINNPTLLRLVAKGYDKSVGTKEEYVSTIISELSEDYSGKEGLDDTRPKPPPKAPSSSNNLSWEKVHNNLTNSDPEVRAKARAQVESYYRETGHWPQLK